MARASNQDSIGGEPVHVFEVTTDRARLVVALPQPSKTITVSYATREVSDRSEKAFRKAQALTGLVTVLGFVASYAVHQAG